MIEAGLGQAGALHLMKSDLESLRVNGNAEIAIVSIIIFLER